MLPTPGTTRTMSTSSLSAGQRIELNDGRIAIVRFVGNTSFQTGDWVGVELEEATGKNDGSVKGERYFECEQGYGMFCRPAGVRQVLDETKPKARSAVNGSQPRARPSSVHTAVNGVKRHGIADAPGRRGSAIVGSPTSGARTAGGLHSPAKSPTKQLGNNGISSTSTSRTNTPPAGRRAAPGVTPKPSRQSMAPPVTTTSRRTSTLPGTSTTATPRNTRLSLAPNAGLGASLPGAMPGRTSSGRHAPPIRPNPMSRSGSATNLDAQDNENDQRDETPSSAPSPPEADGERENEADEEKTSFAPPPVPSDPPPQPMRPRRPSSPTAASIHSQRTVRSTAASNRQIEELEAKVRLLERKRQEDRDVKKGLDQAQQERDQYKGIIEKLQNKYRPQQQEIAELKRAVSDYEKRFGDIEAIQSEHDGAIELATLDREMAEEKAEGLEAELADLRVKNEEMELDIEILREENAELSKEMSPEERTSAGWAQMEKSNERLRDALLRLRDITQDKEGEMKEQIGSLTEQLKELDIVKTQCSETREKLLRSEADTTDLQQQLEAAMQSEDMIEELSARNGRLEDTLSQLRDTVEELEDLRELNDELDLNHQQNEKQLQEEIDFKESLILDRERTAKQQQEALDEADYTIVRYRALVSQMQSDLADMQASKQLSETETADLNSKSRAMLDLNIRLQTSAAKTQIKTIDLELRKLDTQEASEHLAIVQLFLPEAFHAERNSVLALLRFKRIGFKANLVHGFVKERVASFGTRGQDEDVFAACDALDKLTWVAGMAERFVNAIRGCSVDEFANYEGALYELEPVERALNSYIENLRHEELHGKDMAEELQRSIAVMTHLASLHFRDDLASHADDLLMRTLRLQSQLESTASALSITRSMVENNVKISSNDEEEDGKEKEDDDSEAGSASDLSLLLNRAESLISHARNAKVMAGKTYRLLADLEARSLTLEASCTEAFDASETVATEVVVYAREAGEALQALFGEEGRREPFLLDEVSGALSRAATSVFTLSTPEAGPFTALAGRLHALTDILSNLASLPSDLDNAVEFERAPAPWVARAEQLKQTKITSVGTEAGLAQALEDVRRRDVVLREKEAELEEQSVRIEMLEARMKEAGKRSAKIAELERNLHDARDQERQAKAELAKTRQDAERDVERVREEMGKLVEERRKAGGNGTVLDDSALGAGAKTAMRKQEHKIHSLEGAVRYFREENHRLRLPSPDSPLSARSTLDWLHEPLGNAKSERVKRSEAVRKEGREALQRMLLLATTTRAPPVDLTKMPENRLAWRPARETGRWKIERRKEEWEGWREWTREVVRRAN